MTQCLDGRIALITGASRGIGAAVAKAYAREGAHVVLLARTVGGLEETDDAIRAAGGTATLMPLDLLKLKDIDALGPTIAERFGRLDILVGNAAMLGDLSPVAYSDAVMWERVFDLNLHANIRLIRTLHPLLAASDAGCALFVTSGAAHMNVPYWGAYAASKAALEHAVQTYAAENEGTALKIALVDPGEVRTDMHAEAFPGLDPNDFPAPEEIVARFLEPVLPAARKSKQRRA